MDALETGITTIFIASIFANIVFFLIQARKLYRVKDSTGLSFVSFCGFNAIQITTILYGFIKKDPVIAYGYMLVFLSCLMVTFMIYYYQKNDLQHSDSLKKDETTSL